MTSRRARPPARGGLGVKRLFELRETPLSLDECFGAVLRPETGGVALFVGTVRNHNQGQDVTRLEYQAYAAMAEKELAGIATEIERELPGTTLACLHRTGSLAVGDIAVICAASAPHRGEAFSACRELIDRLKARVPIWKREHGEQGPYWIGWQDVRG
jgi:molybdopterin synthase catalytic subunit